MKCQFIGNYEGAYRNRAWLIIKQSQNLSKKVLRALFSPQKKKAKKPAGLIALYADVLLFSINWDQHLAAQGVSAVHCGKEGCAALPEPAKGAYRFYR
jgi:hypothetical protein